MTTIDMINNDEKILELYYKLSKNKQKLNNLITVKNENKEEIDINNLDLQMIDKIEWKPTKTGNYKFEINDNQHFVEVKSVIPNIETFDKYSSGETPEGFSEFINSDNSWNIVKDSKYKDNVAIEGYDGGDQIGLAWTENESMVDMECVIEFLVTDIGQASQQLAALRVDSSLGSNPNRYQFAFDNNRSDIRINKIVDENAMEIASTSFSHSSNTLYLMRIQTIKNNVKMKIWEKDNPEPSSWNIDIQDNDITQKGYPAIVTNRNGRKIKCGYITISDEENGAPVL